MIAPRFPPHGGGGVQRTAFFVHYLTRMGWRPHVLTGVAEERHVLDSSLAELIPESVPVTRVGRFDMDGFVRALGRLHLARVFRTVTPSLPNMEATWIRPAYREGAKVLNSGGFSLIYSSAYPINAHVAALMLKRRFGLPWVADYRDEWSMRSVLRWPTPLHRRLAVALDRRVVAEADQVVTTSPAHTRGFTAAFRPRREIRTITNGFDPADFEGEAADPAVGTPGRFLICHVGTLFEWRFPDGLIRAVADLVEGGVVPRDRIAIRFVGFGSASGDHGLATSGILDSTGYVDHGTAVSWMRAADLLLLFNTERTNIPGKTFEYLAARRPILALCQEGPTCDLIRETGAGVVLRPGDEAGIAAVVEAAYGRWTAGRPALETPEYDTRRFTREELARNLHETFEGVLQRGPSADVSLHEE